MRRFEYIVKHFFFYSSSSHAVLCTSFCEGANYSKAGIELTRFIFALAPRALRGVLH